MNGRDRPFLNEWVQFTHTNHVASVYQLRKALEGAMEVLEDMAVACLSVTKLH